MLNLYQFVSNLKHIFKKVVTQVLIQLRKTTKVWNLILSSFGIVSLYHEPQLQVVKKFLQMYNLNQN